MKLPDRKFEETLGDWVNPLIISFVGGTSSGKTFSALRVAKGIQEVVGGEIHGVDTESGRMLHYKKWFTFRHFHLRPPHGPQDYHAAINGRVSKGAKIIVIDSMTHEHNGEGGVLDQIEAFLDKKVEEKGGEWARDSFKWAAHVVPKTARKKLKQRIVGLGEEVIFLLCYRAVEKVKPNKKGYKERKEEAVLDMGWQAETTSDLRFEATVRFLLTPGCDGVPTLFPPTAEEKKSVKNPEMFREYFKQGMVLDEEVGRRLGAWHLNKSVDANPPTDKAKSTHHLIEGGKYLDGSKTSSEVNDRLKELEGVKHEINPADWKALVGAAEAKKLDFQG